MQREQDRSRLTGVWIKFGLRQLYEGHINVMSNLTRKGEIWNSKRLENTTKKAASGILFKMSLN